MEPKVPASDGPADGEEIVDTYLDKEHRVVKPGEGTATLMRRHVVREGIVVESSVWVIKRRPPA
jgi:hypothetical protein